MRYGQQSGAERLEQAAVENPGKTAALSLLTTPLALKAGGVALRWARRNPGLAFTVAAGALAWWGLKSLRQSGAGASTGTTMGSGTGTRDAGSADSDDSFGFPGAAHGSVTGYGSNGSGEGAGRRSAGGDSSSASSL